MSTYRALPTKTVDLIRRGVAPKDLRVRGARAVWTALVSTASSAYQHGHSYIDWAGLVCERRSGLGRQAALKDGKRERTRLDLEKTLRRAWDQAVAWVDTEAAPAITRQDILARVAAVRDWCADPDSPVTDTDRAVLAYATVVADRNGTDRPTMPRREVMDATGLGERAVRNALERLHKAGLLVLELRGTPGGPDSSQRRASAYRLASAEVLAACTAGTVSDASGAIVAASPVSGRVVELQTPHALAAKALEGADPETLAKVLALLQGQPVGVEGAGGVGGDVVAFDARRRRAVNQ